MNTISKPCKQQYCELRALSPVGIFHADIEGQCSSVNDRWCEIAGISALQALGEGWSQALHPDDKQRVLSEWYRAVQGNLVFKSEYRFQRPDGKITWVLGQALVEKDTAGVVRGYVGIITDISEYKSTEEELRTYRHHLEKLVQDRTAELQQANEQLRREISERQRVEEALRISEERFRLAVDNIPDTFVIYDADRRIQFVNACGVKVSGLPEEALLGHRDEEIFPPEVTNHYLPFLLRAVETRTLQATECTTTLTTGTYTFTVTYLPLLDQQGNIYQILGFTHDISDVYDELRLRIQAEQALRDSERRLTLALAGAKAGSWELDCATYQGIWSDENFKLMGYEPGSCDVHYDNWLKAVHPEDREWAERQVKQVMEENSQLALEYRVLLPDGTVRWLGAIGKITHDERSNQTTMTGIQIDITDRKQLEQELARQKELLDSFIKSAHVGMCALDEQMRYFFVNEALAEINGVSIEDHIGKTPWDVVPDLAPKQEQVFRQVLTTGQPVPHFEISGETLKCPGVTRTWLASYFPIPNLNNQPIGIGIVVVEITERKAAEAALRESEERYRRLMEIASEGIWTLDTNNKTSFVNRRMAEMLGYSVDEMLGMPVLECLDAEHKAIAQTHLKRRRLDIQEQYDLKFRRKDGSDLWAIVSAAPIFNAEGQYAGALGMLTDITARKQAEEAVKQQFARERLIAAIAQRIHESLNLEEILNTTVAEVRQFLGTDRVIIYRFDPDGSGVVVVESVGSDWIPIAGTIIHDCYFAQTYAQLYCQGRVQAVEDIYTSGLTPCHVELLAHFQVKANLVVPIVQQEKLWGLLVAQQCSETRHWQLLEIELLKSLATQAAIAIQKSELYEQAQAEIAQRRQIQATQRQQFLKERLMAATLMRIRQSLDLEDILNTTVAEVQQFLQADRVLIYRLWPNGTGSAVTEAVVPGLPAVLGRIFPEEVFPQESHDLYSEGRILAITDIENAQISPCLAEFVQQFGVRAKLVVPIIQDKTLWGLLIAHHCRSPRQWQPLEIDLLKQLATQVAIAIQQSQLYKQTQHQVQREQALNRVIQTIRNSLDLTTIFSTAVSEIARLLQADRADIAQYLPEQNIWRYVADYYQDRNSASALGLEIADENNQHTTQLKRLEVVRIDDASTCSSEINLSTVQRCAKAWLLVPLHYGSTLWGSLSLVRNSQPSAWQDSEVELACAVADQLAIAIQQSELYQRSCTATAQALTQAEQLEQALQELRRTQAHLVQSEKMSSLGQLVAGVAHEINNPVSFIYGNLMHADGYSQDILDLLELYRQNYPNPTAEIQFKIDAIDLDFLIEDLPKLLCSMRVGAERICEIVAALRNFSRLAEAEIKAVDIHEGLDSTLTILHNRLKAQGKHPEIQVIKEYGNLPKVECYAGQLNQVFMNLLSNAIDAIEESVVRSQASVDTESIIDKGQTTDFHPTVRIRTERLNDNWVVIRIADNGSGMTEQVKSRIFDPFFTTKPVGTGTGLGLSISYQIVVDKHGGKLHCLSELGQGTEFVIQIPLLQLSTN